MRRSRASFEGSPPSEFVSTELGSEFGSEYSTEFGSEYSTEPGSVSSSRRGGVAGAPRLPRLSPDVRAGGALSGAPTGTGRLGEPFGADDAAYTLCDMPRVESRRRRGAASRSRRRVECGVWCRPTQLAHSWRGCRRTERGGRETRLRATGSVPNAPRRAALPLRRRLHRRVAHPVPARLVYSRIERLNKPAVLAGVVSVVKTARVDLIGLFVIDNAR